MEIFADDSGVIPKYRLTVVLPVYLMEPFQVLLDECSGLAIRVSSDEEIKSSAGLVPRGDSFMKSPVLKIDDQFIDLSALEVAVSGMYVSKYIPLI